MKDIRQKIILCVLLILVIMPFADAGVGPGDGHTISSTGATSVRLLRFGAATHFMWHSLSDDQQEINTLAGSGMTSARFDFSWGNSEVTKGTYLYLDKLGQIFSMLDARGILPIVTVIETPAWDRPAGTDVFYPPTAPEYSRMVATLAARFPGRTWEIWNEPSYKTFWAGPGGPDAKAYTGLLKAAYTSIKAADPTATVLGGSLHQNYPDYLTQMIQAGALFYMDALAVHGYDGANPPDYTGSVNSFSRAITEMHALSGKDIYMTEFGWSVPAQPDGLYTMSEGTRAAYLSEAVSVARQYPYVRVVDAYTSDKTYTTQYGLIPVGTPLPSWLAYSAAVNAPPSPAPSLTPPITPSSSTFTSTPTSTPASTATSTAMSTRTRTSTPSATNTPTRTSTSTPTSTQTATATPTATIKPLPLGTPCSAYKVGNTVTVVCP